MHPRLGMHSFFVPLRNRLSDKHIVMSNHLILLAFALPDEFVDIEISGCETKPVLTGVGKACSAIRLTRALLDLRPSLVINIGTAGTFNLHVGDIVVSSHFIDRDFCRLKLPGLEYEKTGSAGILSGKLPSLIDSHEVWNERFTVSTGDDFVTNAESAEGDVVDMEAYAEALACEEQGVPFVSVKYVSDVVGQNSVEIWQDKLSAARNALDHYFKTYLSSTGRD